MVTVTDIISERVSSRTVIFKEVELFPFLSFYSNIATFYHDILKKCDDTKIILFLMKVVLLLWYFQDISNICDSNFIKYESISVNASKKKL